MKSLRNATFLKTKVLEIIDTPLSLSVYLRKKYEVDELPELLPGNYVSAHAYNQDAQALALYSKSKDFSKRDTRKAALVSWFAAEDQCRNTNQRFRNNLFLEKETRAILFTARAFCYRVLGSYSFKPIDDILSPGSTEDLSGLDSNLISKLGSLPMCTAHAYSKVRDVLLEHYLPYAISCGLVSRERGSISLTSSRLPTCAGDSLLFVDKSWKTDRGICPQPLGNLILQRCDARQIRDKLRKFGLCLDTAPLLHEELAKESSLHDHYGTVDLASASDTISYELVKWLLPHDWFDALCCSRTRVTSVDGAPVTLEKFSAMGNGYTFELESLIFYSLCKAIIALYGDKFNQCSVFGDDIIMPSPLCSILIRVLQDVGFNTNAEKTFTTGSFKESCGKDYFNGSFVRPVYLKECGNNEIVRYVYFLNRLYLISRFNDPYGVVYDDRFEKIRNSLLRQLPKQYHCFGPPSYGDSVITGRYTPTTRRYTSTMKIFVKRSRCKIAIPSNRDHSLVCALYGISSTGLTPRAAKYSIVVRTVRCIGTNL